MRNRLVVANWKMNGSLEANARWAEAFLALEDAGCDAAVCAPSVYLSQMACLLKGSSVALGAQDVNEFESGAYTGEVSARMLAEIGCSYVIVGHSERRALYGDTDDRVALKAKAALAAGIHPIVCVGETLEEREAGETIAVVSRQLEAVIGKVGAEDSVRLPTSLFGRLVRVKVQRLRLRRKCMPLYVRNLLAMELSLLKRCESSTAAASSPPMRLRFLPCPTSTVA